MTYKNKLSNLTKQLRGRLALLLTLTLAVAVGCNTKKSKDGGDTDPNTKTNNDNGSSGAGDADAAKNNADVAKKNADAAKKNADAAKKNADAAKKNADAEEKSEKEVVVVEDDENKGDGDAKKTEKERKASVGKAKKQLEGKDLKKDSAALVAIIDKSTLLEELQKDELKRIRAKELKIEKKMILQVGQSSADSNLDAAAIIEGIKVFATKGLDSAEGKAFKGLLALKLVVDEKNNEIKYLPEAVVTFLANLEDYKDYLVSEGTDKKYKVDKKCEKAWESLRKFANVTVETGV